MNEQTSRAFEKLYLLLCISLTLFPWFFFYTYREYSQRSGFAPTTLARPMTTTNLFNADTSMLTSPAPAERDRTFDLRLVVGNGPIFRVIGWFYEELRAYTTE